MLVPVAALSVALEIDGCDLALGEVREHAGPQCVPVALFLRLQLELWAGRLLG